MNIDDIEMLNMQDPLFAEKFKAAVGINQDDILEIVTPQFTRTNGVIVTYFPVTFSDFESLKQLDESTLIKIGCGIWEKTETHTHYLFPGEWFNYIPEGLKILCISGVKETFVKGQTDNDIRFGCLAYGFIKEHQ